MNLHTMNSTELRTLARSIMDSTEEIEDRIKDLRKHADSLYYTARCLKSAAAWSEDKEDPDAPQQVAEFLDEAESALRVYPAKDLRA